MCVYYCSTYYKAVRRGGEGDLEDMCYERLGAHRYMEETQAGGIEFGGTYPVAPNYAPVRQKSLGDRTRPLLMKTYHGPAWRLMSTLLFSWGRVRGVVRVRVRVRVYACVNVCVCVCDFCVCVFVCS